MTDATPTGLSPEHPAILIAQRLFDPYLPPPGPAELAIFADFLRPFFRREIWLIVAIGKYDWPGFGREVGLTEGVRLRDALLRRIGSLAGRGPRAQPRGRRLPKKAVGEANRLPHPITEAIQ